MISAITEGWPQIRGFTSTISMQWGPRWVAIIERVATHQGWPLRGVCISIDFMTQKIPALYNINDYSDTVLCYLVPWQLVLILVLLLHWRPRPTKDKGLFYTVVITYYRPPASSPCSWHLYASWSSCGSCCSVCGSPSWVNVVVFKVFEILNLFLIQSKWEQWEMS